MLKRLQPRHQEEVQPPAIQRRAGWVSLGSDVEIVEETVKPTRFLISSLMCRKRREFSNPSYKFSDRDAHETILECRRFKDATYDLRKKEMDICVDAVPNTTSVATQTTWYQTVNSAVTYEPVDMDVVEKCITEESEEFGSFLQRVQIEYEYALTQNETLDVFEDDFAKLADEDSAWGSKTDDNLNVYNSFTTPFLSKGKRIPCIDWQPKTRGVFAVSVASKMSFEERVLESGQWHGGAILMWNFVDTIHPQMLLEAPNDVLCFKFNPQNPNLIAGGCLNGQVVVWDLTEAVEARKQKHKKVEGDDGTVVTTTIKYVFSSTIEASHKKAVTDLRWVDVGNEIDSKGNMVASESRLVHQFYTTAADGQVLFWDTRLKRDSRKLDIPWSPIYVIPIRHAAGAQTDAFATIHAITQIGSTSTAFIGTTEQGEVIRGDWQRAIDSARVSSGQTADDGVSHLPELVDACSYGHINHIVSFQRSPMFDDVFLTAGDSSFAIWKDGTHAPVFKSAYTSTTVTCARWSPTRASVIFVGKADGNVEIWDLLDQSHKPSMTSNVSPLPLQSMEFWHFHDGRVHAQLLAVGDDDGTARVLELPRKLTRPAQQQDEVVFMQAFVNAEVKRVAYVKERLEVRKHEARGKEIAQLQARSTSTAVALVSESDSAAEDAAEDLAFRADEEAFKKALGMVAAASN
eukprot:TRINITY_DN2837_c0_g1_i2.p1 TRINITY_DN2837_c0_g1~~TRINITY_DN2837_c0_g1_i2.p1  ORF type:complete len:688 (-),score=113.97 TRINITY_DN2837_c0_g1_i2:175-2238(-)